jgi:hypothetical protein
MSKKWLLLGVFGLALVVNPYLACSNSNEQEFTFSESDVKEAVLGTWQGTADLDGETVEFSLVLEQASAKSQTQSLSAPKAQPQCSSRSFVKPAGACGVSTSMPVVGTLTSVNPVLNGVVDGDVNIYGRDLVGAGLALRLEDGTQLSGQIEKQSLSDGSITSKVQQGTFSLSRP